MSSSPGEPIDRASYPPAEHLQGIVERVTYHAEDSGYTVARLKAPGERDLITILGRFPDIHAGQTLRLTGFWREHLKYGRQFQVVHAQETKPATLTGLEKYLGSGLIKGIGPVTARRIVAHFGLETLDIIEQSCSRLIEVPGIGEKRVAMIEKAWAAQQAIKEVMLFLRGHNVSTTYAVKVYKQYGDQAIEVVSKNPYQLAVDIFGIGFVTADTIARNIGIAPDSDFRYQAGMLYVLQQAAEEGHCFLPERELTERVVKRLALPDSPVDPIRIGELIDQMAQDRQLITQSGYGDLEDQRMCYAPAFYHTEQALATRLTTFARAPVAIDLPRVQRWTLRYTEKRDITLSEEQRQAVELAASSRLLVLTGGPGCGKTFTTKTIVALWRAMGKSILLAAPTGRAAQRLSEMTGQEAKTIHRLLAFDPKTMQFRFNEEHPLEAQAIVVDETSMLDLFLAHSLVKAIPPEAQVLLVGDVDQLPSVGPGMVLARPDRLATGSCGAVDPGVPPGCSEPHRNQCPSHQRWPVPPPGADHEVRRVGLPVAGGSGASAGCRGHSSPGERVPAQTRYRSGATGAGALSGDAWRGRHEAAQRDAPTSAQPACAGESGARTWRQHPAGG